MLNFLRGLRALSALGGVICLTYMVFVLICWVVAPTAVLGRAATLHNWLIAFLLFVVAFQLLRRPINELHARGQSVNGTPLLPTLWKL